ncbi:hypothetical protein [Pontibacter liquoris]|uniref:hypothetical protein n=1 Tax=Pontibacter liquoris TaxID=2905677 RepID=UPI001FA7A1D3|nr:hypothetical protein [Pontibacter liquoris]
MSMNILWQPVRVLTALAVVVLLCFAPAAVAIASTNGTAAPQAAAQTGPAPTTAPVVTNGTPTAAKPKPKAVTKPRERSVLDAEVLDSPIAYLRDAFSSEEEEEADVPVRSGAVMMTVKAMVAALLSTII